MIFRLDALLMSSPIGLTIGLPAGLSVVFTDTFFDSLRLNVRPAGLRILPWNQPIAATSAATRLAKSRDLRSH